jgi:hypothetical protein
MPIIRGTVTSIKSGETYSTIGLEDTDGTYHLLVVWEKNAREIPPFLHGIWLSILRDALLNGNTVDINHPEGSGYVVEITLFK